MDVKWIDYSVTEQLEFKFDTTLDYLSVSSVVNHVFRGNVGADYTDPNVLRLPRHFQDVTDWSIGMEYYYSDVLTLRAGYEPRSSVIPENRQDLLIPIADANLYAVGVGYRMDAHSQLDMALGYLVTKIDIKPGESRNSTSTIEGDSVYNPFRGMHVKHKMEALIFTLAYSKHF
jgi:long-subunit fatty acid transport protein